MKEQNPAQLRVDLFGRAARNCPIAIAAWGDRLNADFVDGSRPWQGDICVPGERWLLHVKFWPEPQARRLKRHGVIWEDCEPYIHVGRGLVGTATPEPNRSLVDWLPVAGDGHLSDAEIRHAANPDASTNWLRRAIEQVPEPIRAGLAHFRFGQWRLLRLASCAPETIDLINSNPALAWATASKLGDCPSHRIKASAQQLLGQRQRDIAAWLDFPATEGSVRLLKKVPPDSCGTTPLNELRMLARNAEAAGKLRHLGELPAIVILAVGSRVLGPALTPAALRELVTEVARLKEAARCCTHNAALALAGTPTIAHLLDDTARIAQMLPEAQPPRSVQSLRALRRRHEELIERFLEFSRTPMRPLPPLPQPRSFPPPPFASGHGIEPITNRAGLRAEGSDQRNCVGSYAERVLSGSYYVYRVTYPERATLGLRRDRLRTWIIDQLAGHRNAKVSTALQSHVVQWLQQNAHPSLEKGKPSAQSKAARPQRRPEAINAAQNPSLPGL